MVVMEGCSKIDGSRHSHRLLLPPTRMAGEARPIHVSSRHTRAFACRMHGAAHGASRTPDLEASRWANVPHTGAGVSYTGSGASCL